MNPDETAAPLVGSERVLAVLRHVAGLASGGSLGEIAHASGNSKSTVHRALGALVRAGLVQKDAPGHYVLGDEFLRLAFAHHEARPETERVHHVLKRLAERFGETAHYAVLDGHSIVYRDKVDPTTGAVRLTSVIGGRNPAHATAVGKAVLAVGLRDFEAVARWVGDRTLEAKTSRTVTTAAELHRQLVDVRRRRYATDDQEADTGVNCIAFPVYLTTSREPSGAISVSAVAYRTTMADLAAVAGDISAIISNTQPEIEVPE